MAGKNRDFTKLAAAVAAPGAAASTPTPVPAPAPVAPPPRGRGRPATNTEAMTLRIPVDLKAILINVAAEESMRMGRMITPQEIIIRTISETFARG